MAQYGQIGSFTEADTTRKADPIQLGPISGSLACLLFIGCFLYLLLRGLPFGRVDYDATLLPQTTLVLTKMTNNYAKALTIMGVDKGDAYLCNSPPLKFEKLNYSLAIQVDASGKYQLPFNFNQHSMMTLEIQTVLGIYIIKGFGTLQAFRTNNLDFAVYDYVKPNTADKKVIHIRYADYYFLAFDSRSPYSITGRVEIEATLHDLTDCEHVCKFNPDEHCTIELKGKPSTLTPVLKGSDDLTYWPVLKFGVARVMTMLRVLEILSLVLPVFGGCGLFLYSINWCLNNRLRKSGLPTTTTSPLLMHANETSTLLHR
ncbi:hypothetical protein GEMRC1_004793 [Eukaryota sp. GEM-RC1]